MVFDKGNPPSLVAAGFYYTYILDCFEQGHQVEDFKKAFNTIDEDRGLIYDTETIGIAKS